MKVTVLVVVALPALGAAWALVRLVQGQWFGFEPWLLLTGYVSTLFGVEIGFHRLAAHRAFRPSPLARHLLFAFGSAAAQGPVLFWAAQHRRHHAKEDRPGDPHSPHLHDALPGGRFRGFYHAHFGWLFSARLPDIARECPDLIRDPSTFAHHRRYLLWVVVGLLLPAVIGWAWGGGDVQAGINGLLWGGLARIFLVHHAVWSVNSVCHILGTRPFKAPGRSTDLVWLVPFTLGGAWHNTHHAHPRLADNAVLPGRIDPSGAVIRLLGRLGMASDIVLVKSQALEPVTGEPA